MIYGVKNPTPKLAITMFFCPVQLTLGHFLGFIKPVPEAVNILYQTMCWLYLFPEALRSMSKQEVVVGAEPGALMRVKVGSLIKTE